MFKKRSLIIFSILSAISVSFTPKSIYATKEDPSIITVPKNLAEIKTRQIGKLAGITTPRSQNLDKKEKKELFRLEKWFSNILKNEDSAFKLCLATFAVGLLTSLTPCIYPMIPITAGILSSGAQHGVFHQAARSITYTLGIATVHSSLGYVAATTGLLFGKWLSNPYVVAVLILFFLLMALSMFGFYDISLKFGSTEIPKSRSIITIYIFGLFVGLASSPCISPVLATLLGFVSTLANQFYGFLLLFCFSLGISTILMIIGFFSGTLGSYFPKPGSWMIEVQKGLGFFMLFACVYFASPFLIKYQILALCSIIFLIAFIYYTYSSRNERIVLMLKHKGLLDGLKSDALSTISVRFLIKSALSIIAVALGCYLAYQGFLSYKRTTTVKLITKMLLR